MIYIHFTHLIYMNVNTCRKYSDKYDCVSLWFRGLHICKGIWMWFNGVLCPTIFYSLRAEIIKNLGLWYIDKTEL